MCKKNEKIEYIKSLFEEKNYQLNNIDLQSLENQLDRKPAIIYKIAIEYLEENQSIINLDNVSQLIKINIRIRNIIRDIITAIEESFRTIFLEENYGFDDYEKYKSIKKKNFNQLINSEKNLFDKEMIDVIRNVRNHVSHLSYPILDGSINDLKKSLKKIKNVPFINESTINITINKINNELNKIKIMK